MAHRIPGTMKIKVRVLTAWAYAVMTAFCAFPAHAVEPGDRKLITAGWDIPTPARFRAELAEFEKWGLFDGTVIVPTRRFPDGGQRDCRSAFTRDHWERAEFTEALADLKAARPVTAMHNFLYLLADPGDADWFDDNGWREIVDHWRILAWLAKQGGLRGLHFHTEPYHFPPYSQFRYSAQTQRDRHTYDEYRAKARQRGREVMQAVVAEFPDITVFFDRMFCDLLPLAASPNPALALESHNAYGLQPAFVDGWLDIAPPTVTLVEGGKLAYEFTRQEEFDRAYIQLRTEAPRLLAPEHRARFLSQLRVAFSVYLDAAANPAGAKWHLPPVRGSQAARVEANVVAGLKASDDFVWFHGEQGRWWPGGNKQFPTWPERIPGVDRALLRAAKPEAAARAALAAAQPADNLLANAGFTVTEADGAPAQWWTWQTDDEGIKGSKGRFFVRDGAACVEAVDSGCFGQFVPVKPGEGYAVSVRVRKTGKGVPALGVQWKTADRQFTQEEHNVVLAPGHAEEWCDIVALARVPEGAAQMAVLLGVKRQTGAADLAQFDDARVARMQD